jgi:phosphoribosylanthranilate isomerase
MTVRVKICGVTRPEDAALAIELGASALGFVFWPDSPRVVSVETARLIASRMPPFVARVGVFVDMPPAEVARIVHAVKLDAVQLHGEEQVSRYSSWDTRLIKSVRLESDADVATAAGLPALVTPLVDAADRVKRGGTGKTADWTRAAALSARRPIMLAGGLSAENVADAIRTVRPWAVDVSSGVEASPGVKSPERLTQFFASVRAVAEDRPMAQG